MQNNFRCQIVISGVGGQGVLFITRLLAEAAIEKGLPVFTSETHGMAQRGGTVISHLKVGEFASPLINPGQADGLIALKSENLVPHGGYLKPGGWAAVNGAMPTPGQTSPQTFFLDADRMACDLGDPRSINLIMLGFALSCAQSGGFGPDALYCNLDDIAAGLANRLENKATRHRSALRALLAATDGAAARSTMPTS